MTLRWLNTADGVWCASAGAWEVHDVNGAYQLHGNLRDYTGGHRWTCVGTFPLLADAQSMAAALDKVQ